MRVSAFTAAAAVAAFPAFAAGPTTPFDEPEVVPVAAPVVVDEPAPSADWTGFYIGAQLGTLDVEQGGASGDGLTYGLHAGYRYDFGRIVAGIEGEYDFADIDVGGGSVDSAVRAKASLGFDAGRVLPYATVGFASVDASGGSVDGFAYGAGLVVSLTERLLIGAEILQHDLDGDTDALGLSVRASWKF